MKMKKDVYELTNPQKNIWELEQINGNGTPVNHIFSMLKLKGNLDEKLLDKTLNKIIEQNESFRLKFIRNRNNLQQYVEDYKYIPIEIKHFYTEDISNAITEYQNLELSLDDLFRFCIVLTPEHAKRLMFALQENVMKYERQFGAIRMPEDMNGGQGSPDGKTFIPPLSGFKGEA